MNEGSNYRENHVQLTLPISCGYNRFSCFFLIATFFLFISQQCRSTVKSHCTVAAYLKTVSFQRVLGERNRLNGPVSVASATASALLSILGGSNRVQSAGPTGW